MLICAALIHVILDHAGLRTYTNINWIGKHLLHISLRNFIVHRFIHFPILLFGCGHKTGVSPKSTGYMINAVNIHEMASPA